jgi:Raf kinase inhibitor-like YbhB/YbcL family protein
MAFTIQSPAFPDGDRVPTRFTCEGEDVAPPITVSDPPGGTRSFALIMDDPDAPAGLFTHWLAYDIPAAGNSLQTGEGKSLKNSFGRSGYGGPCPPRGHGAHRYNLSVYALDVLLLKLHGTTRRDLELAIEAHALATAQLQARFERTG